ncbi:MAG: glycosyltransferase family 39 protein [Bacteroidales bacterium]|nr:glycosyltransferase family 39 protein [Bacteroidales bacterium]
MFRSQLHKNVVWLIVFTTLIRAVLAFLIELGNDEVYYWTYALFPDWSHFDHPPMVGFFIQLFSLNLLFDSGFFIRLSSIVFAAVNTYLFFHLGKQIKNERTGWYAALLYTASIYTSVIVGIFILPDTPQVFFWLMSISIMLAILPEKNREKASGKKMLYLGLTIGFAMLSKYTSVFLWLGAGLYILFYNREWLKRYELYLAALISLLLLIPVIYWNLQNDFISFTFQGERANIFSSNIRFDLLGTELGGQFFYNNPFVFVLTWIAVWKSLRTNNFMPKEKLPILLFLSLPLLATFLFVALFRQTLPHWTGPAYLSLMLIAATYLSSLELKKTHWAVKSALILLATIFVLAIAQINFGLLYSAKSVPIDPTLDMFGWRQLNKKIAPLFENDSQAGTMTSDAPILSWRWFPAAHIDFYIAQHNQKVVKAIGGLERIHKYAWMNKQRGSFALGMDAYYLTFSNDFEDPMIKMIPYFETVQAPDTIAIERGGEVVKEAYLYRLKNMIRIPQNELDLKLTH